jgi:hypothetical protein
MNGCVGTLRIAIACARFAGGCRIKASLPKRRVQNGLLRERNSGRSYGWKSTDLAAMTSRRDVSSVVDRVDARRPSMAAADRNAPRGGVPDTMGSVPPG